MGHPSAGCFHPCRDTWPEKMKKQSHDDLSWYGIDREIGELIMVVSAKVLWEKHYINFFLASSSMACIVAFY